MDLLSPPLRGFLQVAALGSVSQAARALGLSQPAVTKQLRALEAALDGPVIERFGRGVRLTARGVVLLDHARRAALLLDDCASALAELDAGNSGTLVVGAGVTTSILQLPPWLGELRRRYPGIDISVRTGSSHDVERWVVAGEIDVGFMTSEVRRPQLVVRRLFEEEIVLVASAGSARRAPVALSELPLILFPRATGFRSYLDQRFAARRLTVNVKMEIDSVEAIKSFVAIGLGAAFLPLGAVRDELARGQLVRLEPSGLGRLRRRTALVWRQDRKPTFALRSFLEIVGTDRR
ncbi:MAG: LysR family transcriptional regulator [Polyangiaceae bacterium]